MQPSTKKRICFVDDETEVRAALSRGLEQEGYEVRCFAEAEECVKHLHRHPVDMVITDFSLPGMDGLSLLREAKKIVQTLPVMIVTGYGDVQLAIKAIKAGAFDFVEKPLDLNKLLSVIRSALHQNDLVSEMEMRLTKTEVQILGHIVQGLPNREIARQVHRSVRTVQDHRNRLMHKLGVHNIADLVMVAVRMGYGSEP